ncbi:MAG: amidohydrolase family protein, partial [Proteobacteria bacterium]|nr:amidohydrolase family protein [Pseudomonadota bacterium]
MRLLVTLLSAMLLAAPSVAADHGRYATYLLLHEVGSETYDLTPAGGGGQTLSIRASLNDRGSVRASSWALTTGPDGAPHRLAQTRDGAPAGEVWRTAVTDGVATVEEPAGRRSFKPPSTAFPIYPTPPAALEGAMIRYWRAHGAPARLPVIRASGDASPAEIQRVGADKIRVGGRVVALTRYTVGGLMFGRQVAWMDGRGRLAALMTFAGGLPVEQVLEPYKPAFDQLVKAGVRQEMALLDAMGRQVRPEASGAFAIVGARLIDGTGAPAVADAAVVVRGGKIVAAGPRSAVVLPAGIKVIHAEGQSLLPGLWEMHSHYSGVEFGPALLAAGVTTARDCGGEFGFLTAVRDRIGRRGALGPRLLLAGLIDSGGLIGFGQVEAETPADGVAAVDRYADAGFQQIKVYTQIKPDVLKAISVEAHRRGLTVTGHVPAAVDAFGGIEDGMDQINHLQFVTQAMRPKGSTEPLDLAGGRAKRLIDMLKDRRIVIDPTVGWGEMGGHPHAIHAAAFEPGLEDAPFTLASKFDAMGSDTEPARYRERTAANLRVIKALYDAGVPIIAGSDTNLIGYGLDRELELYVAAGLPPMAAIQTATLGAAKAMG